jgi:hypothetical protein
MRGKIKLENFFFAPVALSGPASRLFELLLAINYRNGIKSSHGFAIPYQFIKEKADADHGG